ncbi:MAG: hypothetical protein C0425_06270 [Chlorobiaceae bacterium]|nr:hypothetical protein [Chlorobiaceae bacterium]MBA4309925.1 hypothetical protein [Chlorobiaceae bacterium]
MSTLAPPTTKLFPNDSLEKQVYNLVEEFKENLPIVNDRYRLAYNLYKYLTGEGDSPEISVKNAKLKIVGVSKKELSQKLAEELSKIK